MAVVVAWLFCIPLAGAAAVAAAAGARRTETAYPRFVQAQNGYDLITGGFPGHRPARRWRGIEALPAVAQWARIDAAINGHPASPPAPVPEPTAATDLAGRAGFRSTVQVTADGNLRAPARR